MEIAYCGLDLRDGVVHLICRISLSCAKAIFRG
jgi:hypothetical protein